MMGNTLKEKYVIFGAGMGGRRLFALMYQYGFDVGFFIDNDKKKQHQSFLHLGPSIISFSEYLAIKQDYIVVLSTNTQSIVNQLNEAGISFYTSFPGARSFFDLPEVKQRIDEYMLNHFVFSYFDEKFLFDDGLRNWYRKSFCSAQNKKLVEAFQSDAGNLIDESVSETIFFDEYYENRCDLHLVSNLIKLFCKPSSKLIDCGCGHGFLLQHLQTENKYHLTACDASTTRCEYLNSMGLHTVCASLDNIAGVLDGSYDAVVCMEVLEHVADLEKSISELYRILKPGAYAWISVPNGGDCDYETHVRQFSANSLGCAFKRHEFSIEQIMEIPVFFYLNGGHLLMQCRRLNYV